MSTLAQTSNTVLQNKIKWLTYNNNQLTQALDTADKKVQMAEGKVNRLVEQFLTNIFTQDTIINRAATLPRSGVWDETEVKVSNIRIKRRSVKDPQSEQMIITYYMDLTLDEQFIYYSDQYLVKLTGFTFQINLGPSTPEVRKLTHLDEVYAISNIPVTTMEDSFAAKLVEHTQNDDVYDLGTPLTDIIFVVDASGTESKSTLTGHFSVNVESPIKLQVDP